MVNRFSHCPNKIHTDTYLAVLFSLGLFHSRPSSVTFWGSNLNANKLVCVCVHLQTNKSWLCLTHSLTAGERLLFCDALYYFGLFVLLSVHWLNRPVAGLSRLLSIDSAGLTATQCTGIKSKTKPFISRWWMTFLCLEIWMMARAICRWPHWAIHTTTRFDSLIWQASDWVQIILHSVATDWLCWKV